MNKSNFNQTGGFPLKTERLQELQTAYSIFNSLGALAGNLTIISGCTVGAGTVSDGFVYIDGEMYDFRAAAFDANSAVIIVEEAVDRGFKNGLVKQVHAIRYATIGTADVSWPWADFRRVDPMVTMSAKIALLEKKTAIFQEGGAVFPWFKPIADIPDGFQEVVDIRGRTIIGYDPTQSEFDAINKFGGAKNKTLSINEIPAHTHGIRAYVQSGSNDGSGGEAAGIFQDKQTGSTGGGEQFSLLNPYRVAAYIEFIG